MEMCSFNYNYYIVYCWHMNLDRHTHTHMNVTQLQCNLMCKRDVRYRNNLKCSQKSLICLAHSVAWNMQFVFYSKRVKRKLNYFSYLRFRFYLQKKKIYFKLRPLLIKLSVLLDDETQTTEQQTPFFNFF